MENMEKAEMSVEGKIRKHPSGKKTRGDSSALDASAGKRLCMLYNVVQLKCVCIGKVIELRGRQASTRA